MEFFRQCPGCGRRYHVKLVEKKLTRFDRKTENEEKAHKTVKKGMGLGMPTEMVQGDTGPTTVEVATYQYSYKCNHCGHEWKEKQVKEKRKN